MTQPWETNHGYTMRWPATVPPAVCDRCGNRHGPGFIHAGDCTRCRQRPVSERPHSVFCDDCAADLDRERSRPSTETAAAIFARIARNNAR